MKHTSSKLAIALACLCSTVSMQPIAQAEEQTEQAPHVSINTDPYPSTYTPISGKPTVITNVTILDGVGSRIENGMVYFADGKIVAVGETVDYPNDAVVIDGKKMGNARHYR